MDEPFEALRPDDPVGMICRDILELAGGDDRVVVAIAGSPASGKTTLAGALVTALNGEGRAERAAMLPMDGFHLDNRVLEARGLLSRKGAPETFDADGFCSLMTRLQDRSREIVHPVFDRPLDLAIAGAGVIGADIDIVVVEGNYLLLRCAPWDSIRALFHRTVFVGTDMAVIEKRLMERWSALGHAPDEAREKVEHNDLPNARTVIDLSAPADITLRE